jgi:hypothetical protein
MAEKLTFSGMTGTDWRFLRLDGVDKQVVVDRVLYVVTEVPRLLGVFRRIVDVSLAALEAR